MKMRIVSLLMVLLMLTLVLTRCGAPVQARTQSPFEQRFAKERLGRFMYVIVDMFTGVCYLAHIEDSGGGLTTLLDADGTPLTYSEAWHQVFGEAEHAE